MAFVGEFIIAPLFGSPILPTEFKLTPPEVPAIIETVEAKEETIPEKIKRITGNDPLLLAIAEAESNFNPEATNSKSTAKGLFQILKGTAKKYCPEANLFNPEENIECAKKIYEDKKWQPWMSSFPKWKDKIDKQIVNEIITSCSCMAYLHTRGILVKGNASDLVPNSTPIKGGVVVFKYPSGASHAALIERIMGDKMVISESNYYPCEKSKRTISFADKNIYGFLIP